MEPISQPMDAHKEKLWNGQFILLLLLGTMTSVSFFMINPIISKYATLIGASLAVAGVISGLFSITALVARPFGGLFVDRLNKKRILIISTGFMGVAALGYSISTNITMLLIFRFLHGAAFSISSTAVLAMLTTLIPRDRLGEGIGYYGLGQIMATAIGPNIGVYIGDNFGFNRTFLMSAIIFIIAAIAMLRIRYQPTGMDSGEKPPRKKIAFQDLISLKVLPLALISGVFSLTNGVVTTFLLLLGDQRGIDNIALYFTVNAAFLFFVRPIAGKLSDRKGISFILFPAMILTAMESLLLGSANALWMVLLAAAVKALGQGSAQPAIQSACIRKLDPSKSGVATSTCYLGSDIGQGFGPMIGGLISTKLGFGAVFYSCVGLLLLTMTIYFVTTHRLQKPKQTES